MRTTRPLHRTLSAVGALALAAASVLVAAPAATAADGASVIEIAAPTEGLVVGTTLHLEVVITSYESATIRFDDGAPAPISSPYVGDVDLGGWAEGPHTITVDAVDGAGLPSSLVRTFVLDRTPPSVTLVSPEDGSWLDPANSFTILATSTDTGVLTWDLRVDGGLVAGGPGGTPFGYGMPAPTTWADGSSHTVSARATDAVGNVGDAATVTVRADRRKPEVTVDAPTTTLGPAGVVTGTASDTASGVAFVDVDFRRLRPDATCGAVRFSGTTTVADGVWSLGLPAGAESGSFCIRATATDNVGHTRTAADQPVVLVDVTGPDAPRRLSPDGEVWSADTLAWRAVDDAEHYEYRIATEELLLDDADVVAVTAPEAVLDPAPEGSWYWQVRGVDEHGNPGPWSDAAHVTVLDVPTLEDCGTPLLCNVFGDELFLSWEAIPQAARYRVEYSWAGDPSDPSDDIVKTAVVEATGDSFVETQIHFGAALPDGRWSVRVRAVLDHRIDPGSTRLGPFGPAVEFVRDGTRPARPVILGPSSATPLTGPDVTLSWTDDDSVIFWDLKLSTTNERGPSGRNLRHPDQRLMVFDPDGIALFLLFVGGLGGLEGGEEQLAALLANPSCAAFEEFLVAAGDGSETGFLCGDARFVLSQLADGDYWWQVRGYDLISLLDQLVGGSDCGCGAPDPGLHGPSRWSEIGSFTIDHAYVAPHSGGGTPGPGTGGSGAVRPAGGTTPSGTEAVDPAGDDVPGSGDDGADPGEGSGSNEGSGGSDAGGAPEAAPDTADGGGFPLGWLLGGLGLLVLIAGAAGLIRFLVVRRR